MEPRRPLHLPLLFPPLHRLRRAADRLHRLRAAQLLRAHRQPHRGRGQGSVVRQRPVPVGGVDLQHDAGLLRRPRSEADTDFRIAEHMSRSKNLTRDSKRECWCVVFISCLRLFDICNNFAPTTNAEVLMLNSFFPKVYFIKNKNPGTKHKIQLEEEKNLTP